jgi:hypothetical protein
MNANTDPVVEDRIRAAFEQMLPVILGERSQGEHRRTVADAGDQLSLERAVDLVAIGERPRSKSALVVALASCVVLIVAGIVLLSRRVAEVDENPANARPAVGDVLLLPPGTVSANELDQATPGSWSSAIQSPAGDVLGIIASPDFWGELPPDADIRTIGGLTVGSLVGDGNHNYVALPTCAMLNVTTSATIPTWDASVTDLLAGLTSNSGAVTVTLPAGWKELATGPQTEYFNTAFTHAVGSSEREMRLFQSRNANISQFLSQTYRGTALPVNLGQSSAWVVHSNDSSHWNYLIWSIGTTAAMLGGEAISDGDLIATAQSLVPIAPDEWIKRVNAALPPADPATITATTMLPIAIGDQSGCATTSIRFS